MPFGPDSFGEIFESIAGTTKKAVTSTAQTIKSQTIGGTNTNAGGGGPSDAKGGFGGFGGSDFSSLNPLEQNALKQQQQSMLSQMGQGGQPAVSGLSAMAGQQQTADQAKLAETRQKLQMHLQSHRAKYYIPTFEQGPAKIRQERMMRQQQEEQVEEQKKEQVKVIEEKKKQDAVAASMRTRREGEGAKISG